MNVPTSFSFDGQIKSLDGELRSLSLSIEGPEFDEDIQSYVCNYEIRTEDDGRSFTCVGETPEIAQDAACRGIVTGAHQFGCLTVDPCGSPDSLPLPPLLYWEGDVPNYDKLAVDFSGIVENRHLDRREFSLKIWHIGQNADGHSRCMISAAPLLDNLVEVTGYSEELAAYRAHQLVSAVISYLGCCLIDINDKTTQLPKFEFVAPAERSDIEISFSARALLPSGQEKSFVLDVTRPLSFVDGTSVCLVFCPFIAEAPIPVVGADGGQARELAIQFVRSYVDGSSWLDANGNVQSTNASAELVDELGNSVDIPEPSAFGDSAMNDAS